MTTGERIRKWREHAGLSRSNVAEHLGITTAAISYWETDKSTPKPANLERFASLLGISLERFYGLVPRAKGGSAQLAVGKLLMRP